MNNLLNKIGLSALVFSAMIAISSLGYTMAAANQASTPVEEPAQAQAMMIADQECEGGYFKWFTWGKASHDKMTGERGRMGL